MTTNNAPKPGDGAEVQIRAVPCQLKEIGSIVRKTMTQFSGVSGCVA